MCFNNNFSLFKFKLERGIYLPFKGHYARIEAREREGREERAEEREREKGENKGNLKWDSEQEASVYNKD